MTNETVLQGKKYLWRLPDAVHEQALFIASHYNLSIPVAHALAQRGLADRTELDAFLFTSRERDVARPEQMKDVTKAADRILQAIAAQEKILVFGDYDVDGMTATSVMLQSLIPLGARINFFLPNRMKDGYGLSPQVVERAAANGYSLIITVDNGISAHTAADKAVKVGIDLIITDHHQVHDRVPQAYAIVNPNQPECTYPCKALAGVGVAFKLVSYIYELKKRTLPEKIYELLVLGTVADVVPLIGENRFWVRYGLQLSRQSTSYYLTVLKQNAQITKPTLTSLDVGYGLAPQLNALGRLKDPRQGVTFLLGSDRNKVHEIGKTLFELNQARKDVEREILNDIVATIEKGEIDLTTETCIVAARTTWPTGVIGLVASRLVNMYGRPTILLQVTEEGKAKGSCRSIPEFNMFQALQSCEDILDSFGGHAQAAGLALSVDRVSELKARLEQRIAQQLTPFDLQQKLVVDAPITLADVTKKFVADMLHLQPFGHGNSEPVFYCTGVSLVRPPKLLKDAHVKCHIYADGVIKSLIFFNRPELFDVLMQCEKEQKRFSCAVHIHENHWRNTVSIELIGLDVALN